MHPTGRVTSWCCRISTDDPSRPRGGTDRLPRGGRQCRAAPMRSSAESGLAVADLIGDWWARPPFGRRSRWLNGSGRGSGLAFRQLVLVPQTSDGDDPGRPGRLGFHLCPQPFDVDVQGLGVANIGLAPHPIDQRMSGQHPPGVDHEVVQEFELLEGKLHLLASHEHLVTIDVDRDVADHGGIGR